MKSNKLFCGILAIFSVLLSSCSDNYNELYGYKIEENNEEITDVMDNYRNYYEIFVRSFADSNGDGIGDLKGVTEKLSYIKELGYNGIWLMPINSSPSYHKYDVSNYYKIDSDYGDLDDLKVLLDEAEKLNINVILDLVMNHSSTRLNEFKLAGDAFEKFINNQELTEEELIYKDFYSFFKDKNDPNAKNKTLYQYPGKNFYYEGNFSSEMPEFNFDSKEVRNYFKEIAKFYLDIGVDGFRLDAVLYYYFNNTSKNVEFLKEFNDYVKSIDKDAYIVGEAWTNDQTISEYYKSGIDSFFYFPGSISSPNGFYLNSTNLNGMFAKNYFEGLQDLVEVSKNGIPAPFISNHDTSRFTRSTRDFNKFTYGLLAMSNGTIFTYYGDEVGMTGNIKPDENVRTSIKWGKDDKYNTVQLKGITKADYLFGTVEENLKDENSILNYYKKANYLRNKFPIIARGKNSLVDFNKDNGFLIIRKELNNESIDILFNFSSIDLIEIDSEIIGDRQIVGQLVSNQETHIGKLKNGNYTLPPYSIAIIK